MMKKIFFCISMLAMSMLHGTVQAATFQVEMINFAFQPKELTVSPGDTVTWKIKAGIHTTTSGASCAADGIWDSGSLSAGQSFSFTFAAAGNYPYFCIPHCALGMTGMIIVTDGTTTTSVAGTTTTTMLSTTTTTTTAGTCPLGNYLENQEDIHLLHCVRSVLFHTPYGALLTAAYYQNAQEINTILAGNPDLQYKMIELINNNRDRILEFATTGLVVVAGDSEHALIGFLNSLAAEGSMKLRADIDRMIYNIATGSLWKLVESTNRKE
ncbi:MAG: plastocyanin/azurin family copper-binding protein [Pseudomonadota bacterium]